MKKLIATLLIAAIGGFTSLGIYKIFEEKQVNNIPAQQVQNGKLVNYPAYTPEMSVNFTTAAEMSVNAVVHVRTSYMNHASSNIYDPLREFFYGDRGGYQKPQPSTASGSGVIISDDGYIITNNHVVKGADEVEIILNDNRTYKAKIVGTDPATDLALLKVNEKNLNYITYGNSDDVKVGEWVLAVGNPFNLTSTVTAGIVSAKGRNINILNADPDRGVYPIESFIQTDAAVNPGNSGGALVNTSGQLIGINTAIASSTGSYAGYSFAIPVIIVKKIVEDLLEFGEVQRAFIGVSIRDIDAKLASEKKLDIQKGVYVNGLTEGGAARKAGIREGDVISKIGDTYVNTVPELQEQVGRFRPGDKINVTIRRDGQEKLLALVLNNKNGNTSTVKTDKTESLTALGAKFEAVSKDELKRLNLEHGIKVSDITGGKLRSSGIREGFIITQIDKKMIKSNEDIAEALYNKKGGVLIEGVYPNGVRAYYGFGL